MKYFKKVAAIVISVSIMLAMFSACGKEEAKVEDSTDAPVSTNTYDENGLPKDKNVTLKIGFFESGVSIDWFKKATEDFSKKFPNVKFDLTASPKIAEQINTMAQAQDNDGMFDIGYFDTNKYGNSGQLECIDDIFEKKTYDDNTKKVKDILIPGYFDTVVKINNKIYTAYYNQYVSGLFFDKKLFQSKGWNMNPKTLDEFMTLCDTIKAAGVAPIIYPGQYVDYLQRTLQIKIFDFAEANGNKEFENKFRNWEMPQFTSTENLSYMNLVDKFAKKGYFFEGLAGLNHIQSQMMVMQGKAAMVCTSSWIGEEMGKEDSSPKDIEWGFMSVPVSNNKDASNYCQTGLANSFNIWKEKPDLNKKWAKEFLVFLFNKEYQTVLLGSMNAVRVDISGATGSNKAVLDYMKANPNCKTQNLVRAINISDENTKIANKMNNEALSNASFNKLDEAKIKVEMQKVDEYFTKAIKAYKEKQAAGDKK